MAAIPQLLIPLVKLLILKPKVSNVVIRRRLHIEYLLRYQITHRAIYLSVAVIENTDIIWTSGYVFNAPLSQLCFYGNQFRRNIIHAHGKSERRELVPSLPELRKAGFNRIHFALDTPRFAH